MEMMIVERLVREYRIAPVLVGAFMRRWLFSPVQALRDEKLRRSDSAMSALVSFIVASLVAYATYGIHRAGWQVSMEATYVLGTVTGSLSMIGIHFIRDFSRPREWQLVDFLTEVDWLYRMVREKGDPELIIGNDELLMSIVDQTLVKRALERLIEEESHPEKPNNFMVVSERAGRLGLMKHKPAFYFVEAAKMRAAESTAT